MGLPRSVIGTCLVAATAWLPATAQGQQAPQGQQAQQGQQGQQAPQAHKPTARPGVQTQTAQPEPAQPEPAPAPTGVRTAPQLVSLPPLSLPEGLEVDADALQVTIAIDATGGASIEATVAEGELRTLMDAAVAQARFVPATIDGVAVPSRVALRFAVSSPVVDPAPDATAALARPAPAPAAALDPVEITESPDYGARAEVDPPRPTARKLELEEMREVPGAFGDPFRVLDTLPGVVPIFSGLPYVYVRGAPPAGTG